MFTDALSMAAHINQTKAASKSACHNAPRAQSARQKGVRGGSVWDAAPAGAEDNAAFRALYA
jgi:hypothetical protein